MQDLVLKVRNLTVRTKKACCHQQVPKCWWKEGAFAALALSVLRRSISVASALKTDLANLHGNDAGDQIRLMPELGYYQGNVSMRIRGT